MLALRNAASWIAPELCLRIKPRITKEHRRLWEGKKPKKVSWDDLFF